MGRAKPSTPSGSRPPAAGGDLRSPAGPGKRRAALQVATLGCDPLNRLEPHALGVTYWFDTPPEGGPYIVKVRFSGRRIGVKGRPGRGDRFEVVETLDRVVPGAGPVAVTKRLSHVAPGEWHVTASATAETPGPAEGRRAASVVRLGSGSSSGRTGYAPVVRVRAPGARLAVWPALVSVGVVCALVVQSRLARRSDLPTGRVLLISLVASVVGLVGAKLYYLVEHRHRRPSVLTAGMCIQGFVVAAVAALVAGALAAGIPVGRLLDATTPGLLFAMTIGRFGCFFGGCCAGRPTASRWGLWSSDRRLGLRRIPTQLLEAALAATVGLAAWTAVMARPAPPAGTVFIAAMAAYTLGRQLLFPLRDLPRHTHQGRTLTMGLAAAALVVAVAAAFVGR